MAPRAEVGDVRRERARRRVRFPLHAVPAVAFLAVRAVRVVVRDERAVQAAVELLAHLGVARRAVDFPRDGLAGPHLRGVHLRVALAARYFRVPRVREISEAFTAANEPSLEDFSSGFSWQLQTVAVGHALRVEDLPDLVRLVAVHARRQDVALLLPELALDHLAVHRLDLGVAFRAGRGDVLPRDRRRGIRVREDRVPGVAGGAVGSHDEPLPEEPLAVDALGEILDDVVLVDHPLALDRRTLLVALPAEERDLQGRDRASSGSFRKDVVRAVAILARGARAGRPARRPGRGAISIPPPAPRRGSCRSRRARRPPRGGVPSPPGRRGTRRTRSRRGPSRRAFSR